jgi:hypothetical protein
MDVNVDDLHVGSPVTAYRFGTPTAPAIYPDGYLIPRFDHGPNKWGPFVIGLLPIPVAGGILLFKECRLVYAERRW